MAAGLIHARRHVIPHLPAPCYAIRIFCLLFAQVFCILSVSDASIVFLGSKPVGYRCLQHLLAEAKRLDASVIGVLTKARAEFGGAHDLAALADAHGVAVIQHPDEIPACDFLISVQYHRILTPGHLAKANRAAVNLHMAPLPEYRGSNQFTHAILDGKEEFGTTLHIMDARIDHGHILAQRRWPIPAGQWVEDLYTRTVEESVALFKDTLPGLLAGMLTATPQGDLVARYGTALYMRTSIDAAKTLDFSWPVEKLERHLRATYMPGFEPPYAWVAGRKVHLIPDAKKDA